MEHASAPLISNPRTQADDMPHWHLLSRMVGQADNFANTHMTEIFIKFTGSAFLSLNVLARILQFAGTQELLSKLGLQAGKPPP